MVMRKTGLAMGVLLGVAMLSAGGARAGGPSSRPELFGDVQVRNESLVRYGGFSGRDINRSRILIRAGMKGRMDEHWDAAIRLASGGGTTANYADLDMMDGPMTLYIDQIYGRFRAAPGGLAAEVALGRTPLPYVKSMMLWDADYDPDGAAEKLSLKAGRWTVFANFGQHVLSIDSTSNYGAGFCGYQSGFDVETGIGKVTLAAAYYDFLDPEGVQDVPGKRYAIADGHVAFARKLGSVPVRLWGDLFKNVAADADSWAGGAGFVVGEADALGRPEATWTGMIIDADAIWIDLNDSNFTKGLRKADEHGCVSRVAIGLGRNVKLRVSWHFKQAMGSPAHEDQVHTDLMIKF